MSDTQAPEEISESQRKEDALEKKRAQLALAREKAAEKRRALGDLTKQKKSNKDAAYNLIVQEEAEKERVILERFKDLERKKQVTKPKRVYDEPELQPEPEPSDDDESTPREKPKPDPKPKRTTRVKQQPPSDSESDSSEDEAILRKRARKQVRAERSAVLAESYKKSIEDIKLQELKSIMRGGGW